MKFKSTLFFALIIFSAFFATGCVRKRNLADMLPGISREEMEQSKKVDDIRFAIREIKGKEREEGFTDKEGCPAHLYHLRVTSMRAKEYSIKLKNNANLCKKDVVEKLYMNDAWGAAATGLAWFVGGLVGGLVLMVAAISDSNAEHNIDFNENVVGVLAAVSGFYGVLGGLYGVWVRGFETEKMKNQFIYAGNNKKKIPPYTISDLVVASSIKLGTLNFSLKEKGAEEKKLVTFHL